MMQVDWSSFRPIFRFTPSLHEGVHGPYWQVQCYPGHLIGVGKSFRQAMTSVHDLIRWTVEEDGWAWFAQPASLAP